MTVRLKAEVETKGPIFKRSAITVTERAITSALREIVQEGESFMFQKFRPRPQGVYLATPPAQGGSTGHYRRSISSKVERTRAEINDGNVVYGPWLEGLSSRNSANGFEGYAVFRKASQHLQKKARGILDKHASKLTRKLGGRG